MFSVVGKMLLYSLYKCCTMTFSYWLFNPHLHKASCSRSFLCIIMFRFEHLIFYGSVLCYRCIGNVIRANWKVRGMDRELFGTRSWWMHIKWPLGLHIHVHVHLYAFLLISLIWVSGCLSLHVVRNFSPCHVCHHFADLYFQNQQRCNHSWKKPDIFRHIPGL